ncbi:hypothetical protein BO71DRAFT_403278 [Aspergillus ellipticus CBS 707.79]|uniref:Transcriptional regulator n=1 Tax=Aspergillus ellipticus CBS 707.79 TaxID=1448320 RepID=A0A319CV86_9EURO|nr:hypothetical protein BO71DRAFT_403278 [Aspergillus ellipticus CBS 707.79]
MLWVMDGMFLLIWDCWLQESEEKAAQESAPEEDAASDSENAKPAKRSKPTKPAASRKRRKTSASDSEDGGEEEVKTPATKPSMATEKKPSPRPSEEYVQDGSDVEGEGAKPEDKEDQDMEDQDKEDQDKEDQPPKDDSESEMSVVLDEEPKPKPTRKRQKSAEAAPRKGKKQAPAKGKDADADPNQAEIKRLQGWLVKCGIRKMWARELAPYDSPKAKIKHLKDMLKDAGMEGRYSAEKASRIREERELKADLELVQEGAKRWGKGSGEENEEGDDSAPKRRLNRGRKSLAFLESEGEETD